MKLQVTDPQKGVTWEENLCFKINVLPGKIINYYILHLHNKTQASKDEKVIGFETTVFAILVTDMTKQICCKKMNLYLRRNNCWV